MDTKVKIKFNLSNHSLNRSKTNVCCIVDRSAVCGWICLLGSWTSNLSVETSCLLFTFHIITPHDCIKSLCIISSFFFPESLNGTPGIWALLEIRISEHSWSLLFELSLPPLSSRPLTRPILQANWPLGCRSVFTSSPLGAGWTARGEGVLHLPYHQHRLKAWTASPYNCPQQHLDRRTRSWPEQCSSRNGKKWKTLSHSLQTADINYVKITFIFYVCM